MDGLFNYPLKKNSHLMKPHVKHFSHIVVFKVGAEDLWGAFRKWRKIISGLTLKLL